MIFEGMFGHNYVEISEGPALTAVPDARALFTPPEHLLSGGTVMEHDPAVPRTAEALAEETALLRAIVGARIYIHNFLT